MGGAGTPVMDLMYKKLNINTVMGNSSIVPPSFINLTYAV
jgi:hypothetical protein